MRDLDPSSAAAGYLRLVERLTSVGGRIDAASLAELARAATPVNPVEAGLTRLSPIEAHSFREAFAEQLRHGVDWGVITGELGKQVDAEAARARERGEARDETSHIVMTKLLVADILATPGMKKPDGAIIPSAMPGADGALYFVFNDAGTFGSVIRYADGKTSARRLPTGRAVRELVSDSAGNVSVACIMAPRNGAGGLLTLVDARTGAEKSYPIPKPLARLAENSRWFPPSGTATPKTYLVEDAQGKRTSIITWRTENQPHTTVVPLDGQTALKIAAWSGPNWKFFATRNRRRLIASGIVMGGETVVKDLVSGEELLRESNPLGSYGHADAVWLHEDGEGELRAAWSGAKGHWKERNLTTGIGRELELDGGRPREVAGYVTGTSGKPTFLAERMQPRHGRTFTIVRDGAATTETKAGVVVSQKMLLTFTTPDGRHYVLGHDNNGGRYDKHLQFAELGSGETGKLPLPTVDQWQLGELHRLTDGRVVALLNVVGADGWTSASLVQVFGPR